MHSLQNLHSFDQAILQDQLLRILQRSPETSRYIGQRISEIIVDIMSGPAVQELQDRVNQLEGLVEELESERRSLSASHGKQSNKDKSFIQRYRDKARQLEEELRAMKDIGIERDNYKMHIQQLEKEKRDMERLSKEQGDRCEKLAVGLEESSKECAKIGGQLMELRKEYDRKCEQLINVEGELQKLKGMCKQTKYKEISYKRQGQKLKQDHEQTTQQLHQLRQQLKSFQTHRDNERKALTQKLSQLHSKSTRLQKTNKKLSLILQSTHKLKQQHSKLKEELATKLALLAEESRKGCCLLMDQIGEEVNRELKLLMAKLGKNGAEVRIYREEVRIKDEIIQKLEKVASVQVMGNRELQRELKAKKLEADGLRKELKRNYEESEIRFMGLENSYRQILTNTINHPLR